LAAQDKAKFLIDFQDSSPTHFQTRGLKVPHKVDLQAYQAATRW